MKTLIPLSILLLTTFSIPAQHLQTVSHFTAGGAQDDAITDIKTDTAGSIYITGHFTGTVDFDPGTGTYNLSTATGHTQPDAFIQKLDANGNLLWAKSFGGNTDGFLSGTRMAIDDSGYVYLTGSYQRDIRFTPGGNLWSSGSTNETRPFLVKLDGQGNVVWGRAWQNGNSSHWFTAEDVFADSQFNVYIMGSFAGTVDFNPSTVFEFRTASSSADGYLLKLNHSGDFEKILTIGGATGQNQISSMRFDGFNNFYLVGFHSDTVDFDFGIGVEKRGATGFRAGFILKVDTSFDYHWVKTFKSSISCVLSSMIVEPSSEIYATGRFRGMVNLSSNPNNPIVYNAGSSGITFAFVQKFDSNGNLTWVRVLDGNGYIRIHDFSSSGKGELMAVGQFNNTYDFNDGTNSVNFPSNGGLDAFALKIDTAGNYIASAQFGGAQDERLDAVSFVSPSRIFTGGEFEGTLNINPNATPQMVTSAGGSDMLFMELQLCTSDTNNLNVTACGRYTAPSGNTTYTASGTYYDTIPGSASGGCDSILEINLTLLPAMDTSVTQTATSLTANATGVGYQWYDCQTEQIIPGETGQTFEPTSAGQYAVIIDDGTCTDTSACKTMHNIGLPEYAQIPVKLYPNPTDGLLHIKSPQAWQRAEITDLIGRTLLTSREPNRPLDLTKLPSGVYLVKVYFENGVSVEKVVIEH